MSDDNDPMLSLFGSEPAKVTERRRGGGVREIAGTAYTAGERIETFRHALDLAGEKPDELDGDRADKKNYAEKLSNKIAVLFANRLRLTGQFSGVLPNPDGSGRESTVASGSGKKPKKTDVRCGTFETGLELLVSIKTLTFRDRKGNPRKGNATLGRYTKNMVRNDHELRAEAMDVHERQPFAVLVAILFLPVTACDDGGNDKSSFAHAIATFRRRAGRDKPSERHELFERMFIGLFEPDGDKRGEIAFFDVMHAPPRRGRPRSGLRSLEELMAEIVKTYGLRSGRYIQYADEEESAVPELAPITEEEEEEDDS